MGHQPNLRAELSIPADDTAGYGSWSDSPLFTSQLYYIHASPFPAETARHLNPDILEAWRQQAFRSKRYELGRLQLASAFRLSWFADSASGQDKRDFLLDWHWWPAAAGSFVTLVRCHSAFLPMIHQASQGVAEETHGRPAASGVPNGQGGLVCPRRSDLLWSEARTEGA